MIVRYGIVLLIALALYGVSSAPGAVWQDSGLIQHRVWHNDVEGSGGLALSHPLYYLIAIGVKHIPFGDFGHRVNLISALAAAVAVANLYLLVRLWLGRDFPAVIAAGTLAVSHTFWWHASIAETYTLWAALFLGELVLLLLYARSREGTAHQEQRAPEEMVCTPRVVGVPPSDCGQDARDTLVCTAHPTLYALGLLNGLAVAVHMLATIPLACYGVFLLVLLVRRSIRVRDLAIFAALWVLGALPYEYLILKNMVQTGDVLGTLASAAFGDRWQADVLNTSLSWKLMQENLLLVVLNFPTPNALLFFMGLVGLRRVGRTAGFRAVVLALLVLFLLFASRYTVADRYAFFLPFYSMVAVVIGVGVYELRSRFRHPAVSYAIAAFAVLPVIIYAAAPGMAQRLNVPIGTRHDIPYRNDYEYFLRPWRTGYRGAERFAREALEIAEPNAILHADSTTVPPLLYVQEVQGCRPDVKIVANLARSQGAPRFDEQTIAPLLEEHPIYVVSKQPGYCPRFILDRYLLAEAGVLWRVLKPAD